MMAKQSLDKPFRLVSARRMIYVLDLQDVQVNIYTLKSGNEVGGGGGYYAGQHEDTKEDATGGRKLSDIHKYSSVAVLTIAGLSSEQRSCRSQC